MERIGQGEVDVRTISLLRAELSAAQAHLVVEQVALRKRARRKFSRAARMFFTAPALEQATDETVAAYKASRFPAGAEVSDLCCGIGGDMLGLFMRSDVVAVDRDPVVALLAQANGQVVLADAPGPRYKLRVLTSSVDERAVEGCAAWHLDPDRRATGRRVSQLVSYEPGPDVIASLLSAQPSAAVKLAPAAQPPDVWAAEAELEWISRAGQCRQLVAWFGALAKSPGKRRATVLSGATETSTHLPRTVVGEPTAGALLAERPGRYVYEPDAAVLAAELTDYLAGEHGLTRIARNVAYLTGDHIVKDGALAAFEVLEVMPYDLRCVKAALRQRKIGRLEIKTRGLKEDPPALRGRLALEGDEIAVLLLARTAAGVLAILARRVSA